MLSFAGCEQVDLTAPRRERACILAPGPEQNQFCDIAEIEAHSTAIRATVFAYLVPDDICFVTKTPGFNHCQTFRQQGVRAPEIEMGRLACEFFNRQGHDLFECHRVITR